MLILATTFIACGDDDKDDPEPVTPEAPAPEDPAPEDPNQPTNTTVTIYDDGTTSTGAPYIRFLDGEFMYNYIHYKIVDNHVNVRYRDGAYYFDEIREKLNGCIEIPSSFILKGETFEVQEISSGAFSDNRAVNTVIIPKTVKAIKSGAFFQCKNLENINLGHITSLGSESIFKYCSKLNEIDLSSIENHEEAYKGFNSTQIHTLKLSDKLEKIDLHDFEDCLPLRVFLPTMSVVDIYGFQRADSWGKLQPLWSYITLCVPEALLDAYKSRYGNEFHDIISIESTH